MRFLRLIFSRIFFCLLVIAVLFAAVIFLCLYIHSLLPAALGVALAYALSLAASLSLVCRDMPTEFKCAWLAVVAALPVVGALLYALSFPRNRKQTAKRTPPTEVFFRSCEYFSDGTAYLTRLTECVASAKNSIYLEYYIVSDGKIWRSLCRELEKALDRGAEVRLVYDGLGSALLAPKKDFNALRKKGAEIRVFHRLLPFPVSRLNARNHRKIAVIDRETVFLGGVNVADEYANLSSPHGYWKDGGVLLRGEIAERFSSVFLADFYGCERRSHSSPEPSSARNKESTFPEPSGERKKESSSPALCENRALAVVDAPSQGDAACEELLTEKIYAAQRRVYIFTPYLCVGEKLKSALTAAAARGADVKAIVPDIPDKRLTFEITLSFCAELAKQGVEVYRYTPGFMHTKGVLCDDGALLGSYNFDFRSMRLNYECGVWVTGRLAERFCDDFENSLRLSKKFAEQKPSPVRLALRGALKLFAPLV